MGDLAPDIGRIAISKAGRDVGKAFLIFAIVDDQYVLLVDGKYHKLDAPKKKKLKHLILKAEIAETIRQKWLSDAKVFDSQVRSVLEQIISNLNPQE